ncbi:hypothetical protein Acr_00g0076940 [Actinidia rufa]|uniref:Uncharacterized protein n=1 Tax=Actinidia rufa TaxID=165716 RepID=A0A7J0DT82_9ERIC|nr:hypothetical protein Acr_00g0076940 [Actinidia rufa]
MRFYFDSSNYANVPHFLSILILFTDERDLASHQQISKFLRPISDAIANDNDSLDSFSLATLTLEGDIFRVKTAISCSSRRYGAPVPNRVGNGVRTSPHAPFEDRRVRSVSATRPGRSHALPRTRGRTHAPARAPRKGCHVPTRAATRQEGGSRAATHQQAAHALSRAPGIGHVLARAERKATRGGGSQVAATRRPVSVQSALTQPLTVDFDRTGGLYRLEGNVQTGRATVRHGSSGISKENGQGKQPLHRGTQSKRRGTWRIRSGTRAQGDALGYVQKSGHTRVVQLVQDVHREVQRKETKSILRNCIAKGMATSKRVSFALDLISGGVLSSCAHKGGEMESRQLAN